jgi:serine/threonine-protein kinase
MPTSPNRLSKFWQELKRRKVIRTITVYAAAAFIILELLSIIIEPLRLPDWTLQFAIVFLCIGFIVAVILSWIYDIHPDGGMVKTEAVDMVKEEDSPKSSNSWKIASYVGFVVIIGLIVLNIVPRSENEEFLEKSVAVLPFHFYSSDSEVEDIGDAFANEIITQLYKIKGFDRIISHTSTLQYKGSNKLSMPDIGKALNANYIIEGSMERQHEGISIQVQIIQAKNDDHIWADEFTDKWDSIFVIRSKIAKKVASELKTILTPQEIDLIDKEPTDNLKAFDYYLLANQYTITKTENNLLKAIDLFKSAIDLDPRFALAYVGLANSYMDLFWYANWLPQDAYERARELALEALELDSDLAEAHTALAKIKRNYDWDLQGAEEGFRQALKLNQNSAGTHIEYAYLQNITGNFREGHFHARKALELNPNSFEYDSYYGFTFFLINQIDSAINYLKSCIEVNSDIVSPHYFLGYLYIENEEYENAIDELEMAVKLDSVSQPYRYYLGIANARAGKLSETKKHLEVFNDLAKESRTVSFGKAALFAELREVDSSIFWLQKAYNERYRYFLYLRTYRVLFSPIRKDPRFLEIYHQIWPNDN